MILSNGRVVSAQIETIADRTPLFADASYYPRVAVELLGMWAAYGAIYRTQLWVNTIIRKLAYGTARLPLDVRRAGAGNEMEQGPLTDLLARPTPHLDAFRLWMWTSATFDVYGEAYWLKLRDSTGQPRELHPIHPSNLIIRRDENGTPFYIYSAGVRNVSFLPPIPYDDVVPFVSYNPEMPERGLSNLEPLRQTLLSEDAARRATASWWQRGARPSLMLSAPGQLSEGAVKRLQEQVDRVHGGADQFGGTVVLEEAVKPVPVQLSAEEMQYIESRKLNREEVCAAFDVPPPVVHILDRATFSNITEQMRSMYRDTMAPRLGLFESVLAHHLVPDFDPSGELAARFRLDDVLRGDFETRAQAVSQLIQSGVMKPSEARPLFDLDDAGEIADRLYANSQLQELGSPAENIRITAGTPANPIPATPAEEADVQDAINSAARSSRQADEQTPPEQRGASRDQRRARERRRRWLTGSEEQE